MTAIPIATTPSDLLRIADLSAAQLARCSTSPTR